MTTGIVTRFSAGIGCGITKLGDGTEIYIHCVEIATPGVTFLQVRDQATFDVYRTEKGVAATNVRLSVDAHAKALLERHGRGRNGGKPQTRAEPPPEHPEAEIPSRRSIT